MTRPEPAQADILGGKFSARTISLPDDRFGPATATLVRRPAARNTRGAILLLHGFCDYFFNTELAEYLADRGFDVYGLDLRGHGRSWQPHQIPNFTTDLTVYFTELDEAARLIRQDDGHRQLIVLGHSTGGLVGALWAHERRDTDVLDALVLNSPWLEIAEPLLTRTVGVAMFSAIGQALPTLVKSSGAALTRHTHTAHIAISTANGTTDWTGNPLAASGCERGGLARLGARSDACAAASMCECQYLCCTPSAAGFASKPGARRQ